MRCQAQTKAAARCSRPALRGSKRCVMHTEGRAREIGRKGGLRRRVFNPENLSPLETPRTAEDLTIFVAMTMTEVRLARIDPRIANALSQLGGIFLRGLELGELAKRVATLEANRRGEEGNENESSKQD